MLSRAIDTHAALKKPRDREWIHILLAFLKTYVSDKSTELVMSEEQIEEYIAELVNALQEAAEKLDSGRWVLLILYACGTLIGNLQISFIPIIRGYQLMLRVVPTQVRRKIVFPWK